MVTDGSFGINLIEIRVSICTSNDGFLHHRRHLIVQNKGFTSLFLMVSTSTRKGNGKISH